MIVILGLAANAATGMAQIPIPFPPNTLTCKPVSLTSVNWGQPVHKAVAGAYTQPSHKVHLTEVGEKLIF